ncbi:MAG: hypothetical protein Q9184_000283 [Pyrenodesmia sp. 2 TL-2023]
MTGRRSKITRLKFLDPYKRLRVAALEIQAKQALAEKCDALAHENQALAGKNVALAENNNRLQQQESRNVERQEATRSKLCHVKQGIAKLERQRDSYILKCANLERQHLQLRKETEQLVNKQSDIEDRESQIEAKLSEQGQLRKKNHEQEVLIKELQSKAADSEACLSARVTQCVEATVNQMLAPTSILSYSPRNSLQRVADEEPVNSSWPGYDPDAFLSLSATVGSSDNMFVIT